MSWNSSSKNSHVSFSAGTGLAEVLPTIEAALALDPKSPSLRVVNGTILVGSGGIPQALQEIEAAVQLRADAPRQLNLVQLHLSQAGVLEMSGQPDVAEALFDEGNRMVGEILERWPRYGRAHMTMSTIYSALQQPDRARVELETAEALSPESPMLWLLWAQFHVAENDPAAAIGKLRRAIALDPENLQLRMQAARIFHAAGDEEAAQENVDAALRLVAPEKRAEVRQFLDRSMGAGMTSGIAPPPVASDDRGLKLPEPAVLGGDPSKLRLRDPDESLELELDE